AAPDPGADRGHRAPAGRRRDRAVDSVRRAHDPVRAGPGTARRTRRLGYYRVRRRHHPRRRHRRTGADGRGQDLHAGRSHPRHRRLGQVLPRRAPPRLTRRYPARPRPPPSPPPPRRSPPPRAPPPPAPPPLPGPRPPRPATRTPHPPTPRRPRTPSFRDHGDVAVGGWQNKSETSRIGLASMITDTFPRVEPKSVREHGSGAGGTAISP